MHKHTFSIFIDNLSDLVEDIEPDGNFEFKDKKNYHRITEVLRLKPNENIIFFDEHINIKAELLEKTFQEKNDICVKILTKEHNKTLKPEIILCPAVLKKDSFEQVIYDAAAMGANIIRPVITEKIQRKWAGQKDRDRLRKVMIAACEQSKNFILPELQNPITLPVFLKSIENLSCKKIFFDFRGEPFSECLQNLNGSPIEKICIFFGPEGGIIENELQLLKIKGFEVYKLTPTILRSETAVTVGLGIVRTIFRNGN